MITLFPHQLIISSRLKASLSVHHFAILQAPERCGKTLSVIDAIEKSNGVNRVLWVTKKMAISGINGDVALYEATKHYDVVNYEALHKVVGDYDLIVLDEFHYAISSYPKEPIKVSTLKQWQNVPKILLSATPSSESVSQWYHPLSLCSGHPFSEFKTFYAWFKVYGIPKQKNIMGRIINDYSNGRDAIMDEVLPFLIQITREQLGGFEHKPVVVPHFIPLTNETIANLSTLYRDRVLNVDGVEYVADTPLSVVNGLYQLECGCLKVGDKYLDMGNREMVDYIKEKWGDTDQVAIMIRWVGQRNIFEKEFKHAQIFSSISHAEGVEMAHIETLVIASMDYSTARFQQRNARQASSKRTTPINVHILMVKGGISEIVYNQVALKHQDFKARMVIR